MFNALINKRNKAGQALVEAALVISLLLIVIFIGMSFLVRCSLVKINQQLELRQVMFSKPSETPIENFSLNSLVSFISDIACGEKVSTEVESVKLPYALRQSFEDEEHVNIKSSIYILRGCWNTREFIHKLKNTKFIGGSINELLKGVDTAEEFVKEAEKNIIK